ncbi:MAG: hypothetical protein K6L81_03325 [Agarilytica sp.]
MKIWLTYILVILVTLQSIATFADAYEFHQSNKERLSFNDVSLNSEAPEPTINKTELLEEQERDCNHCCQCHGHGCPAILVRSLNFTLQKTRSDISTYRENTSSEIINSLLRPPISHT